MFLITGNAVLCPSAAGVTDSGVELGGLSLNLRVLGFGVFRYSPCCGSSVELFRLHPEQPKALNSKPQEF